MTIFLNNHERELSEPATVTAVLQLLELPHSRGLAIAINNEVLPRDQWPTHQLRPNDRLTLIRATQGG
ncbi:sulfur carrier protein ThiS [Pontibacter sp. E15-1]|uniref:sulfur carrier protein ThiS n=1 Tax=Pontibacter sp. E15-1 TaxID=2919918 RepID=UPI001F500440|nr:sulfur carrier protein ThiS [Pontibacter sp. E15-1]MCJ8165137.1 sulfur carrier protein ThiS [Pontibacter sp. E15-1]